MVEGPADVDPLAHADRQREHDRLAAARAARARRRSHGGRQGAGRDLGRMVRRSSYPVRDPGERVHEAALGALSGVAPDAQARRCPSGRDGRRDRAWAGGGAMKTSTQVRAPHLTARIILVMGQKVDDLAELRSLMRRAQEAERRLTAEIASDLGTTGPAPLRGAQGLAPGGEATGAARGAAR